MDSGARGVTGWLDRRKRRRTFTTVDRGPFYDLALGFLPSDPSACIVDIGCGNGGFAKRLELHRRYDNVFMLDANPDTIARLRGEYPRVVLYRAPEPLPFSDSSVHYVHLSHVIEHLQPTDMYRLLKEVDRVLVQGGVLNISTPLLWRRFYDDLSHVRPYGVMILKRYLVNSTGPSTSLAVSSEYEVVSFQHRYTRVELLEHAASDVLAADLMIALVRGLLRVLRLYCYMPNGYTVFLRKTCTQSLPRSGGMGQTGA